MIVKIKKLHKDAVIPSYSKIGDAGLDLTAVSKIYDEYGNVEYGVGLAIEIPKGYVGLIFPRSSISKKDLILSNSVGVIDSGYRGEIKFKFKPSNIFIDYDGKSTIDNGNICGSRTDKFDEITTPGDIYGFEEYTIGDRIGQLIIIPYPEIELEEVDELNESERGEGGYGSTGN